MWPQARQLVLQLADQMVGAAADQAQNCATHNQDVHTNWYLPSINFDGSSLNEFPLLNATIGSE